jgi:hypothetical protein
MKFFEYINGRVPPFRNFSDVVTGAEIDVRINLAFLDMLFGPSSQSVK